MALFGMFGRSKTTTPFARKLSAEQEQEALDLLEDGVEIAEIATDLGVHPRTIRRLRDKRLKPRSPQQALKDMVAATQLRVIEENPELQSRLAEHAVDQLAGTPRKQELTLSQLAEAREADEKAGFVRLHRLELERLHKREDRLRQDLKEANEDIRELERELRRSGRGGEDDEPSWFEKIGMAPEAQAALVRDGMAMLQSGFRGIVPGANPSTVGDGQAPNGAALPAPSAISPGVFFAGYLAQSPEQAAAMIGAKANDGVVFDRVPLASLAMLLAADPHRPEQVVNALCALPEGDVLRSAIERTNWPTWLPTFVSALVNWPEPDATAPQETTPAAAPNGVVHEQNGVATLQSVQTEVLPADVLERLKTMAPSDLAAWAVAIPAVAEQLGQLAGVDDDQVPDLLHKAALFGPEEWKPVVKWLRTHPARTRELVAEVRRRGVPSLAPEDGAGATSLAAEDDAGA